MDVTKIEVNLTPDELVSRWRERISAATLANWRACSPPKGPAFLRAGGRVLYPLRDVEAYERANRHGGDDADRDPCDEHHDRQ